VGERIATTSSQGQPLLGRRKTNIVKQTLGGDSCGRNGGGGEGPLNRPQRTRHETEKESIKFCKKKIQEKEGKGQNTVLKKKKKGRGDHGHQALGS